MLKLFYLKGACSMVPHTALEWIAHPYTAVEATREYIKSAEYRELNPQGSVPLLIDGNFALSQNIAILYYLDLRYPQAKIFGDGDSKERAMLMRWLSFINSDLHKSFSPLFHAPTGLDDNGKKAVQEFYKNNIYHLFKLPEEQLAEQAYLGTEFTVVDVYLYVILRWAKGLQLDLDTYPNLLAFFERVQNQAVVIAVLKQEGLL